MLEALDPADELAQLATASGDAEAFELVYSALMARYSTSSRVRHMTQFADEVTALAISALRQDGRLLPGGATTRSEWTWRHNRFTATHDASHDRTRAERSAATCSAGFPNDDVGVVQRTVSTWPDGSALVGRWLPAPAGEIDDSSVNKEG